MQLNVSNRWWLGALCGCFAACASIQAVPYNLQPSRIADPRAEILGFIKMNVRPGCLAEPQFEGPMLDVKFVCSGGLGHSMARLDRVAGIKIEQYEEWYRVVVQHTGGTDDFSWSSKNLEDVQRAADAFYALAGPKTNPAKSPESI